MLIPARQVLPDQVFINPWSRNSIGPRLRGASISSPSSGALTAARAYFVPFWVAAPYSLQRFWWQNGATVGTDNVQAAVYGVDGSNNLDAVVSCGPTLSAGTANYVQYAGCSAVAHGITSGTNTTDATSFATASVTLVARPGVMYVLSVVNTHGTSANTVTAQTTGGAVTFTSRGTIQHNGTLSRTTLFTAVPTSDVTATITITIGSGQTATACLWSLVAFTNVDTTSNDGIVQTVTATGSSTTPSVTLAAFGSANNATFGAHGTAQTSAAPGSGFLELHDVTASTPTCGLETEYRKDNDTSVDATITSAQWGSIAVEVASLGTTRVLAPGLYYMALMCFGSTATFFRRIGAAELPAAGLYNQSSLTAGLPQRVTLTAAANDTLVNFGITNRATP